MAALSNKKRPAGTANGKPRSAPLQGQPRGGNFIGNQFKVQGTPWSESVRVTNKTINVKHPDEREGRRIV